MKTKSLFAGLVLAAMTITSCSDGGSNGAPEPKAPETFADSVSMYIGKLTGTQMLAGFENVPDSLKAKIDKQKFLEGMKYILDADTSSNFMDGMQAGLQLINEIMQAKNAGVELNRELLQQYFAQAYLADSLNLETVKNMQTEGEGVMTAYQEKLQSYAVEQQAKMEAQMQQIYAKNVAAGKQFMDQLKSDPAVKTTESGLAYKVEKQGTGAVAKEGDTVPVIFTGKFIDGTVFDSSNNQVANFQVDQVIPGFKEALTMFPAGSKVTLYVPQELGYGLYGSQSVMPGQTLVFDIEICEK